MTLRSLVAISTLLPWMSCSEIPMASPDATCNCPTPNASQVSYSNTASHLTSTSVQAALDELTAKPAEPPIGPRIYDKQMDAPAVTTTQAQASIACDDTTHDVAIGGGCFLATSNPAAMLASSGTSLSPPAFGCSYQQATGGNSIAIHVNVICIRNAR